MSNTMKYTLLQYVQNILSAADSDEVNSISDTAESLQAANCVQQAYFNMLGKFDLPEHNQLFQLNASGNPLQPVLMTKPDGITRIEWVKYYDSNPSDGQQTGQFGAYSHDVNTDITTSPGFFATSTTSNTIALTSQAFTIAAGLTLSPGALITASSGVNSETGTLTSYAGTTLLMKVTSVIGSGTYANWNFFYGGANQAPGYIDVPVVPVQEFMHINQSITADTEGNVGTMQLTVTNVASGQMQNFNINYFNDRRPSMCCILSNFYIVFDAYDSTQDSTLQQSKVMAYGWVYPTFTMSDSFVPSLDAQQVPLLLNEAKSLFFFEIKQQPHTKAEEEITRQVQALQKWKALSDRENGRTYFSELPNFGRTGAWGGYWY